MTSEAPRPAPSPIEGVLRTVVAALSVGQVAMVVWMVVAHGTFVDGFIQRSLPGRSEEITPFVAELALTLSGAAVLLAVPTATLLAWRGEGRTSRILGLFVIVVGAWSCLDVAHASPWGALVGHVTGVDVDFLVQVLAGAAFLWFTGAFGAELGASPLQRRAVVLAWIAVGSMVAVVLIDPMGGAWEAVAGVMGVVSALLLLFMIDRGLRRLRTVVRSASAENRQRVAWIFNGMLVSFVVGVVGWAFPSVIEGVMLSQATANGGSALFWADRTVLVTGPVLPLVLVSSVALSVFYRGSVDAELMLRRTTVSSILGVVFVFLFAGLEQVVSNQLDRVLTVPSSLGVFLSGGIAALIVAPFHGRVSRLAAKVMPAREGDAVSPGAPEHGG